MAWTVVHVPDCRHMPESYLVYLATLRTSNLNSNQLAKVVAEIDETARFIERISQIETELNPQPTLPADTDAQGFTFYILQVGKWRVDYYIDAANQKISGTQCTHKVKLPIV